MLYTKEFATKDDAEAYKALIDAEPCGSYIGVVVEDAEGFIVEVWKK